MNRLLSIAMPTYNGERFLREQIDSILSQTVQEFELVISDDCSTDNTLSIANEFAQNDVRIKVLSNKKNIGFKKNVEKVLKACSGEYILLSDQDDIWMPNHIEVLMCEANDSQAMLICGRPVFVDEFNCELPNTFDYFKMDYVPKNDIEHAQHIFMGRSSYQGASMLIRRNFLEKALPIPECAGYHDNWFAALSVFYGGLRYVDTPILRYRRWSNAITIGSKRQSAFRKFIGGLLFNHALKDRIAILSEIEIRISDLSAEKKELLYLFKKMIKRRNTLLGRIENLFYVIPHFKAIYSYDGKHLFT